MMWTPQNIPAGWEVDSGYTTEDGTTGERWCVLAREVER